MAVDTSQALQHLHELLKQLDDAETLLAHGPRRIAAAEKKVAAAQEIVDAGKKEIRELRAAADDRSLSLKSREADILKLRSRLNEAASNREYDIIQSQIASEKAACEKLEDEILQLLTSVDEAESKLQAAEDEVREQTNRCREIEADVRSREPEIRSEIERLETEIREAEQAVPAGDARTVYRRLRDAMKAQALSEVQDAFCMACNTKVIAQDCVRIKVGEFVTCRQCGRILYLSAAEA